MAPRGTGREDMSKEKDTGQEQGEEILSIWDKATPSELKEIESHSKGYIDFLTAAKTERKVFSHVLGLLEKSGFTDLSGPSAKPKSGGGYLAHHGKLLGAFVPGREKPSEGFNLIVAHGESPRLDIKPRCVYEDGGFAMIKTNLYGGLKKFQWLARPVALWGFSALKDGRTAEYVLGEDPGDPVLTITDILPHMDRKVQR